MSHYNSFLKKLRQVEILLAIRTGGDSEFCTQFSWDCMF
jgi:hypothetical protein